MKHLITNKYNLAISLLYMVLLLGLFLSINKIIQNKIKEHEYQKNEIVAKKIHAELSTLINEKKDATLAMAISLASSDLFKKALLSNDISKIDLKNISQEYKDNTVFKNIWLQVIDKEGKSFVRSWTEKKGDNLGQVREDINWVIANKKTKNSISVGRFSISFKSMVPIFNDEEFIGIFEVISHFNSIEKKLQSYGYDSILLVDAKFKEQLTHTVTNTFINDYYVASFEPNETIMNKLKEIDFKSLLYDNQFYFEYEHTHLFIIETIFDQNNDAMAYMIVFVPNQVLPSDIHKIKIIYYLYGFLAALIVTAFYFLLLDKQKLAQKLKDYHYNTKIIVAMIFFFMLFVFLFYRFIEYEKQTKIDAFLKSKTQLHEKIYHQIYNKYFDVASIIFNSKINTPEVKQILQIPNKEQSRKKLYAHLNSTYEMFSNYNLKQLHFHTPQNHSFLRFHRPQKFGDDLTNIRATVAYVNRYKKPIDGFEEGKIYNGFRFVFPLFDDTLYLGSVEVSFSALYMLEELIKNFNYKGNFFIQKKIAQKKLMDDELSNYIQSDLQDFYFEQSIFNRISNEHNGINLCIHNKKQLQVLNEKAKGNESFSFNACNNQVITFIPLINPIENRSVGIIAISEYDQYISNKKSNSFYTFLTLISTVIIGLFFAYRELIGKRTMGIINEQLNKAQKVAKVGNWSLNLRTQEFYWSDEIYNIFEIEKNEKRANYELFMNVIHHEDKKMVEDAYKESLKNKTTYSIEHRLIMKDGRIKYVKESFETLFDERGTPIACNGTVQDITEQQLSKITITQAKQKAEEANKAKSDFLANMSHEIRTPMNAIIGFGNMLYDMIQEPSEKEILRKINASSQMLLGIINDILDYSKIEAGKFELDMHPFELQKVLTQLKIIFEHKAKEKGISLSFNLDEKIPKTLICDELRLTQVLTNLLSNAVKFTHKGSVVLKISLIQKEVQNKQALIEFSIKDSGIGMTQTQIKKIFNPFTQADNSTTRKYGGTGLGLVICKNIIEALDASIDIQSTLNEGTCFTFTLNLKYTNTALPKQNKSIAINSVDMDLKNTHILVVEDNHINQQVVALMLSKAGITYDIANNGQEGVEMFLKQPNAYNLILMDLQMPIKSGYEAAQEIRQHHQEIPIIALTAAAMIEDKQKALDVGMNEHLAKPIDVNALYALIAQFTNKDLRQDKNIVSPNTNKALDLEALLQTTHSKKIAHKLLTQLQKQLQKGEFKELVDAVASNKKEAPHLIHSLKGVSGNLKAHHLYNITQSIDTKYKKNQTATPRDIQKLQNAIDDFLKEVASLEVFQDTNTYEKLKKKALLTHLIRLKHALENGDLIQEKSIKLLVYNLYEYVSKNELAQFEELVNDFEFDAALQLLKSWDIEHKVFD